jgi:hypothetical protein
MIHSKKNGPTLAYPEPHPCALPDGCPPPLLDMSTLHPHVRALVQAVIDRADHLSRHRAGTVRMHYHRERVKVSLELFL